MRRSAVPGASACRGRNCPTVPPEEDQEEEGQREARQKAQVNGGGVAVQRRSARAVCRFHAGVSPLSVPPADSLFYLLSVFSLFVFFIFFVFLICSQIKLFLPD